MNKSCTLQLALRLQAPTAIVDVLALAVHHLTNIKSMRDDGYDAIAALYTKLPAYTPLVPTALLPYIATILLLATFVLGFYFTTLPRDVVPLREGGVAILASCLAGFGVVSLFCAAGVNV